MATWTTNTTSTDDAAPSPLQKTLDNAISLGKAVAKFLLILIIVMAEGFSIPKIELANSNSQAVRVEMDDLIRAGNTKELEFSQYDMALYRTMMALVTNMRFGDFELEGAKAQEFWTAYAPEEKSDTTLDYLRFQSAARRVSLRYANGIAAQITLEFDDTYLYKAVYLRKDVFNGNPIRWLYWILIGRFVSGYPCYVTEANLNGNGVSGDLNLKKYAIRNQIFSWSFTPGKRRRIENITEHWVTREAQV
jgi:hypothetical protein